MAKKSKERKEIPEGMKCYKKLGGGSFRFPNRIIKKGQSFWAYPTAIPSAFKDTIEETAADYNAVIIFSTGASPVASQSKSVEPVSVTFEMTPALDADGNNITKGNSNLYNVVDSEGKVLNEKPLRKGKATELLETLSA
jgi:hypothetical protein